MEMTVIILPPSLLPPPPTLPSSPHTPGFITVLELLDQARFELCGLKLALLSRDRARAVCEAVSMASYKVCD